ncbi:MAG TPA: hypothetical protein VFM70_12090 [Salinimicrobium sp.]|mgnify:CR=1 FL=1|nr:hypothetical protein [Salinimicrobium sp.]
MKKSIIVFALFLAFVGCKSEQEETITLNGEFIFVEDAAVLKGDDFIYGVVVDEKAKELAEKTKSYQKEKYDMIPVEVAAVIKENPNKDGWEKIIEIKEIISVSDQRKASKLKMNGIQFSGN